MAGWLLLTSERERDRARESERDERSINQILINQTEKNNKERKREREEREDDGVVGVVVVVVTPWAARIGVHLVSDDGGPGQ